jgi:hypothetical protein
MSIYVDIQCQCGANVLQDTFEDLPSAIRHLVGLNKMVGDEPQCLTCTEEQTAKDDAETRRQTRREPNEY